MSTPPERPHDPAIDRAATLIRQLDSHKSDAPHPAEPMERAVARLIDLVVWFIIGTVVSIVPYVVNERILVDSEGRRPNQFDMAQSAPLPNTMEWAAFVVSIVMVGAYEVIPTARTGRHFAKTRMGLWVTGPNGEVPGFRRALIRWGAWWIPLAVAFSFFGLTFGTDWGLLAIGLQAAALAIPGTIFFADDGRGIHDRLAGTRVMTAR